MAIARRLMVLLVALTLLSGIAALTPAPAGASGIWSATGGMLSARAYHTATLLPSGKVLVTGGFGSVGYYGYGSLNSTELFDPTTGTWSAAAPMGTARQEHTATLLANGKVLVLGGKHISYPGGNQQTDYLATGELYDPATNGWTPVAALAAARYGHVALIFNRGIRAGKVLVLGSGPGGNVARGAEEYDPDTQVTTPLAAPTGEYYARPTTVPLADGRVFIMEGGSCVTRAEVYDPQSNTWTTTASTAGRRCGTGATLLPNGKVLVVERYAETPQRSIDGYAELYDPATNAWQALGELPYGPESYAVLVTLPSGIVLGVDNSSGYSGAESGRFNAATGIWSSAPSPHFFTVGPRIDDYSYTVTLLSDGRVLSTGGGNGFQTVGNAELYNDTPFTVALSSTQGGSASVAPPGPHTGGATATLTASAVPGYLFTGWTVNGTTASYANPLSLPINDQSYTVVATFGPQLTFPDVPQGSPATEPIAQLAARGIIKGYADGRFGPDDRTVRAQMAALICRAVGWDGETWPNPFIDRNGVDDDLWRNVGTLNHHAVARGYGNNTYGTTDDVLNVQVIAFISRAMVDKGYWQQQYARDSALYPNVPSASGHRDDLATYIHYAGALPDNPNTGGGFAGWDQPSTRGWFARALWQALASYYATNHAP